MRRIRQILRLAWEAGLKQRQIARSLTMSPATVGEYLRRARLAGLSWPLPGELDDTQLEARLFLWMAATKCAYSANSRRVVRPIGGIRH